MIAALAGCDLGPRYQRPDISSPGTWREAGDGQAAALWPSADWWKGFGSSELDRLVAKAQATSFDLGAAAARVRKADALARVAGAALLPTVTAAAGGASERVLLPIDGGLRVQTPNYDLALNAAYEIDFWGKNRAAVAAATATAQATRYEQQVVALTVVTTVATSYFDVLALQERLEVARANLAAAESTLEVITGRREIGTAMDLDVAEQQTIVAGLRAVIPSLEQQISQTTDALAVLVGTPPEELALAPASFDELTLPPIAPGLPSDLLERRPDIAEIEAQLKAANADITVARAEFFPSFDLTAQGGFGSLALAHFLSPASAIYNLAASATQPIFEGGQLEGRRDFALASFEELVQTYRKSIISAFGNVEDALAAARRTGEQQTEQEATVKAARLSFEIAQGRYNGGLVDLLTVLTTENALFPARDALVQVKLAHLQAVVSLFNALGGGWESEELAGVELGPRHAAQAM
jgi:NodT family efflux transporter outer membrane factor (OMF) lipoprotein